MVQAHRVTGLPPEAQQVIAITDLSKYGPDDVILIQIEPANPERARNTAETLAQLIQPHTKAKIFGVFHQCHILEFIKSEKFKELSGVQELEGS